METVTSLAQFLQIICNRSNWMDELGDDHINPILSRENTMLKEYIYLCKNAEKATDYQELDNYIYQNYEHLYSYYFNRDYVERINTSEKERPIYFYRGVSDAEHPIASGIYRSTEWHEENYYFNEISVRCPEAFRALNTIEKLTYMQHYGCPTRLLDITSNPLVALYFACQDNCDKDGSVYIFRTYPEDVLYANSNRIQMLSKLAEFTKKEQRHLRKLAYRNLFREKFPQLTSGKYRDAVVEQYFHAIKRNDGAFERELVPLDILRPLFVQPNKDNPRILKQDGAFVLSGLDAGERESNMKIRKYLAKTVNIKMDEKQKLRKELEIVGINQATLFPEVDKVAAYLREKI